MKYRYTVTAEGTCEANTSAEAEAAALWEVDNGLELYRVVSVETYRTVRPEPLTKGEGET